jgi:hypothetical protein
MEISVETISQSFDVINVHEGCSHHLEILNASSRRLSKEFMMLATFAKPVELI